MTACLTVPPPAAGHRHWAGSRAGHRRICGPRLGLALALCDRQRTCGSRWGKRHACGNVRPKTAVKLACLLRLCCSSRWPAHAAPAWPAHATTPSPQWRATCCTPATSPCVAAPRRRYKHSSRRAAGCGVNPSSSDQCSSVLALPPLCLFFSAAPASYLHRLPTSPTDTGALAVCVQRAADVAKAGPPAAHPHKRAGH